MCVPVAVTTAGVISAGGMTLMSHFVALAVLASVLIVNFRSKIKALLRR